MKNLLLHAWIVRKSCGRYFLPFTHWVYLREICKYYDHVCLLSPTVDEQDAASVRELMGIEGLRVSVYELPGAVTYLGSIRHFPSYFRAYRQLAPSYEVSYVRYPAPFGWLQYLFFRKNRIVHYVGDPVESIQNNVNLPAWKKFAYIAGFMPERLLYTWASRGAERVFANGAHLSNKLGQRGVKATALVSSTLVEEDFHFQENKQIQPASPRLIYVGYLRKAKGVETLLDAFRILKADFAGARLQIVGSGDFETQLRSIARDYGLDGVEFLGHIDSRAILNGLLREADIFCFASVSEGSPRVILEAMANGLNVVTTPVGSLPHVFRDENELLFADFNDGPDFASKISTLIRDPQLAQRTRQAGFEKVQSMGIAQFIKGIFDVA